MRQLTALATTQELMLHTPVYGDLPTMAASYLIRCWEHPGLGLIKDALTPVESAQQIKVSRDVGPRCLLSQTWPLAELGVRLF